MIQIRQQPGPDRDRAASVKARVAWAALALAFALLATGCDVDNAGGGAGAPGATPVPSIGPDPNNTPPEATQGSATVAEDDAVTLVLGGRDDDVGDTLRFEIVRPPEHGRLSGDGDVRAYTPDEDFNGEDNFLFRVLDDDGANDTAIFNLTVTPINDPPAAQALEVQAAGLTPTSVTLEGRDIDGDPLTFNVVTAPTLGTLTGDAPNLTYTANDDDDAVDSWTFTVSDGEVTSEEATVTVFISGTTLDNAPPVATSSDVTTAEDTPITLTLTGEDEDDDPLSVIILAPPLSGTLTGDPSTPTWTPAPDFVGEDSLRFIVNDGKDDSEPATVALTVTPVNDPPLADDAALTTEEDTPLAFSLSGLDVDDDLDQLRFTVLEGPNHGELSGDPPTLVYTPDEDFHGEDSLRFAINDGELDSDAATVTLTVTPVNDPPVGLAETLETREETAIAFALRADDAEGDTLSFAVTQAPANGQLVGQAPALTYTPDPGFVGEDQLTFTASDGAATSTPTVVTFRVEPEDNIPPIAFAQSLVLDEDTFLTIELGGFDEDNDALSFTLLTSPNRGSLAGSPPTLTYRPNPNATGTDRFTFVAEDGTDASEAATVTLLVAPINDPPVALGQTVSTDEDDPIQFNIRGADLDDDEDSLTFEVIAAPTHGQLSGAPPALTYDPAPDHFGLDSFLFVVSDGALTSEPAAVTIQIAPVDDPPQVDAGPDTDAGPGPRLTLAGQVSDDGPPDALSVQWSLSAGPGEVIFSDDTALETEVRFERSGLHVLRLTADDGAQQRFDDVFVEVLLVNEAPVVSAGGDTATQTNTPLTLTGTFVDDGLPEGGQVTSLWRQVEGPGAATFATPGHLETEVTFEVPGAYTLALRVDDGERFAEATLSVVVVLDGDNQPPSVNAGPDGETVIPSPRLLEASASDDGRPDNTLSAQWSQVAGPGEALFGPATAIVTRVNFTEPGRYVLRLSVSDGELSVSDEVVVVALDEPDPNEAPIVDAGPDLLTRLGLPIGLEGTFLDDGLPEDGQVIIAWSQVSGPGETLFTTPDTLETAVNFTEFGQYVLRLSVSDGAKTSVDELTAVVEPPANAPPQVDAGPDLTLNLGERANLEGVVVDDDLPRGGALILTWSQVAGPGNTEFENLGEARTTATFNAPGAYTLRLSATDGALTSADEVVVVVTAP